MESNKPNNFKEAALSHIPTDIVHSMVKETQIQTDGLSPLEAIAKAMGKGPLPQKTEAPDAGKQYISLAVDGNVIKISVDPTEGAVTMLLYLLATVWSKDKKIAKVLKQFKFHFYDQNNVQLYPKKK